MKPGALGTLFTVVAAGCAAAEPHATAPATVITATPSASAPPAPTATPLTACETANKEQRAALSRFFDEHRRMSGAFDGRAFVRDYCWEDPKGAWALSFLDVKITPGRMVKTPFPRDISPEATGTMAILRVGADGARAVSPPHKLAFVTATLFDWNHDGTPELALPTDEADLSPLAVWTSTPAGVVPYAPASSVRARLIHDIDGDERPDLLYTFPFDGRISSFDGIDVGRVGPPETGGFWLAAHARADGSFSIDDAAAIEFAKKGCPDGDLATPPDAPNGPEGAVSLAGRVRCAKLWGVQREKIDKQISRECKRPSQCADLKMLREWAAATPPITLK